MIKGYHFLLPHRWKTQFKWGLDKYVLYVLKQKSTAFLLVKQEYEQNLKDKSGGIFFLLVNKSHKQDLTYTTDRQYLILLCHRAPLFPKTKKRHNQNVQKLFCCKRRKRYRVMHMQQVPAITFLGQFSALCHKINIRTCPTWNSLNTSCDRSWLHSCDPETKPQQEEPAVSKRVWL